MSTHRSPRARTAALVVAGLALAAPLAACSSDDEDDADTSTEASTDDTMADEMSDDTMADDMTDDTMAEDEESSGEIETTGVLDFLNEEDPAVGALFDWNEGEGTIAVNYLGTQTVGLYGMEVDEATAMTACELTSEYAFEIDEEADIEVYTGGYSDGVLVVSRSGESGTCAAA